MPSVIKKIHHVAIVVDDLDEALSFWQDSLGLKPSRVEEVPAEGAKIVFIPLGEGQIEIVKPTVPDTGLSRYLEKRGSGIHHICLQIDDLETMLDQLKQKGVRLVNEIPVKDTEGIKYAFIHPESAQGVLVELYEVS